MTPDDLPGRWRMAVEQLGRGAFDAPWSAASRLSVVRRTAVMVAFVGYGLYSGNFDTAVFAAFGALQLGLGEAALPFRRLLGFLSLQVVALGAVGFVAASLAGSWWTVPFLTALAFVNGATVSVGLVPRATGIGALAIGVIFCGLTGLDPVTAAMWLAFGAAAQAVLWLISWRWEREYSVRRALANCLRSVMRMVRSTGLSGRDTNLASAELDEVRRLIDTSGTPSGAQAHRVADGIGAVRRAVVAWRIIREPGAADRLAVGESIRRTIRDLDESIAPARPSPASQDGPEWEVTRHLRRCLTDLHSRVRDLRSDPTAMSERAPLPAGPDAESTTGRWRGFVPGTPEFRHGVRMGLAILVGQSLSVLTGVAHSFWIPLTVVFVVKSEWSFTVVRSSARVLGNLAAVILIPVALTVVEPWKAGVLLLVGIVSAIAFRYFSGNYIVASFGVAGTILVLDHTLDPAGALYGLRILFTIVGAIVGLLASAAVPTWRGRTARPQLAQVVAGLTDWSDVVCRAVQEPTGADQARIRTAGEAERNHLIQIRPAVEASLLEPFSRTDPRPMVVAVDAASRAHLSLVAMTVTARLDEEAHRPGVPIGPQAAAIHESLRDAGRTLQTILEGGTPVRDSDSTAPQEGTPVCDRPQDLAVAIEADRLRQAAVDIDRAVAWLSPEGGTTTRK